MINGEVSFRYFLIFVISFYFFSAIDALVHYDQTNGHSELVIERVSKDDAGTYTCVAENDVGTIKSLAFVYVKGKSTLSLTILMLLHLSKLL